jgi:hypothetical protein
MKEIEDLVNSTMLSRKRKDELIESLLILFGVVAQSKQLVCDACNNGTGMSSGGTFHICHKCGEVAN